MFKRFTNEASIIIPIYSIIKAVGISLVRIPLWQLGPEGAYPGVPYIVFLGNLVFGHIVIIREIMLAFSIENKEVKSRVVSGTLVKYVLVALCKVT